MGKRIGIVVAVEAFAVKSLYGEAELWCSVTGFDVRRYDLYGLEIYVVKSGAGQIAAASAAQMLISRFEAELIINFGTAGALNPELKVGDICLPEYVVHYDFDCSELGQDFVPGRHAEYENVKIPVYRCDKKNGNGNDSGSYAVDPDNTIWSMGRLRRVLADAKVVTCASGDKVVAFRESRCSLAEAFDADIVEMEAAAVLITCQRNCVPCVIVKCISDGISEMSECCDEKNNNIRTISESDFENAAVKCFTAVDTLILQSSEC